jgi:hypothetical protein
MFVLIHIVRSSIDCPINDFHSDRVIDSDKILLLFQPFVKADGNDNTIYIFQEKQLRGHSPNFHIHVSVSVFHIPRISPHFPLAE